MKKILPTFAFIFSLLLSNQCIAQNLPYTISSEEIDLTFTIAYRFDDLALVKSELEKLDIKLSYSLLEFDENGYLKRISAAIEYPNGKKGSFVSRELQLGDGPGFRQKL